MAGSLSKSSPTAVSDGYSVFSASIQRRQKSRGTYGHVSWRIPSNPSVPTHQSEFWMM